MSMGMTNVGFARSRMVALAAGAAVSIGMFSVRAQAQVWISPTSGNFSDTTKWLGGVAPISDPTTALMFPLGAGTAVTATVDASYTSPVTVNSITFASARPMTVAAATGKIIQLGGAAPAINVNGWSFVNPASSTISAPIRLGGDVTIGGTGMGNLNLSGARTDDGTARTLTIPALPAVLTTTSLGQVFHTVVLSAPWTGLAGSHVVLDGGNAMINSVSTAVLGPAGSTFTVTPNGGVLQFAMGGVNTTSLIINTIQLDGTLRMIGGGNVTNALTLNTQTKLNGAGRLMYTPALGVNMTIQSDSSLWTGGLEIDKSYLPQFYPITGTLTISGLVGQIGSTSVDVRSGGTLALTNTSTTVNQNRIPDTTPVHMRNANFTVTGFGTATVPFNETIGALDGAGYSVITTTSNTSGNQSILTSASLARTDRGTFLFRGAALGSSSGLRGNIIFTAPPADLVGGGGAAGTNNISILPYAIGDITAAGTGSSLVTYDATAGIRPLDPTTEYAADVSSGATTNARLTSAVVTGGDTVNAMVITPGGAVSGSGTLNVTSGAILNASTTGSISVPVAFGAAEGQIFGAGTTATASTLQIDAPLTGSNGLTKSGGGALNLTADNSGLTGQLTLNAGFINFNSMGALPGTGQIRANSTGGGSPSNNVAGNTQPNAAGLTYSGGGALNFNRDIRVDNSFVNIGCANGGESLTLSGQVSGNGGLFVHTTAGSDVYLTNANNTHAGGTFFYLGNVHVNSDGVFGAAGSPVNITASLILEGDWTTNRNVNFSTGGTSTIDTNGHNLTLNGPFTSYTTGLLSQSTGTVIKSGAGALTIGGNYNAFANTLQIDGGSLIVNGTLPPSQVVTPITINAGATLGGSGTIYRNINLANDSTLAPGNSTGILTQYGNLAFANATFAVQINGNTPGTGYDQMVVNGTVTLGGNILAISLGYTPAATDKFFILTNDDVDPIAGEFFFLPEGSSITLGTIPAGPVTGTISYQGDAATGATSGGNDVVIHTIVLPTPACRADVAGLGGSIGADGVLTADDLVVYLNQFFIGNLAVADLVGLGGSGGPDGTISVDDIVAFLGAFFAGCP